MDINWAAPVPVANGIHIRSKTISDAGNISIDRAGMW